MMMALHEVFMCCTTVQIDRKKLCISHVIYFLPTNMYSATANVNTLLNYYTNHCTYIKFIKFTH